MSTRSLLSRFALIGAAIAAPVVLFASTAGWFSPERINGDSLVHAIQSNTGTVFPGFRRAHAKGLCVSGTFSSNGAGAALSRASLFQPGVRPVDGRFSLAGGNPDAPDGRNVFHALGLRFPLPHGEEWRMALDHAPIFPVSTAADFQAFLTASKPDLATQKPDPKRIAAFLAEHPETQRFLAYMKSEPLPSSFSNGTYYSIDAFRFTNADGMMQNVRWQFEPGDNFTALDKKTLDSLPPYALFDEYLARSKKEPVRWHLIVIVGNPGDRTDNATIAWGSNHRRVDTGMLTLTSAVPETQGDCRDIVFDPLILPQGVAASDDPLLSARSAAYSASFRKRAIEGPRPDPVSLHEEEAR